MRQIPNVFDDTPKDKIRDEKRAYKALETEESNIKSPELPEKYNKLDNIDTSKTLSRKALYSVLTNFTPYLIQNLLYISNSPTSSNRDKVQASKILLNKILPDLQANQIQLETNSLESLVIVKTPTKTDKKQAENGTIIKDK